MASDDLKIRHDPTNSRFIVEFDDGQKAELLYKNEPKDTLDMYETQVPPQYRGKEIAGQLVKTAFDYAEEKNFKVNPTCTYVKTFLFKNQIPKYLKLIVRK